MRPPAPRCCSARRRRRDAGSILATNSERVSATASPARVPTAAIGFASLRGGSVAGDHSVLFLGDGRAHRAVAPRREPRDLRDRRGQGGALADRPAARALHDAASAGALSAVNKADTLEFFRRLAEANPVPETELMSGNVYQLLVAVVLSAQATDVGVNRATKRLFEDWCRPPSRWWRWAKRRSRSTSRRSGCSTPRPRT